MKRRVLAAMAVGFLLALTGGGVAHAAPTYLSSEPADGERVHKPPKRVSITFSEPLDASSTITVRDHCGRTLSNGNVRIQVNEMSVGITKRPSGHYIVTYTAVGLAGITGSTKGNFGFRVHAGKSCSGVQHKHQPRTTGTGHGNGHGNGSAQPHETHPPTATGEEHSGDHAGGMKQGHAPHQGDNKKHAGRQHGDKRAHGLGHDENESEDRFQPQALDQGQTPVPDFVPGSEAVLAALLAAAGLGAFGGWILRNSPLG
jgi:methionine-rich copper-binding protein CopC